MADSSNNRRTRALVDPEVQGGLIRKIAIHWALLFVCNSLALVIWLRLFEQPDANWSETVSQCSRRFFPFFLISMTLIPAFVWDTLKLTNRFAGPVRRLRAALADAGQGRAVAPLKFRSNDFWGEIAENFNSLAARAQLVDNAAGEGPNQADEPQS